ncbi:MAG: amino acid adenylation domain-containing protein [Planctomycetes bacterium]|nr:amino acid adenylation domain-containing protein [Planctomycetota bacterium]
MTESAPTFPCRIREAARVHAHRIALEGPGCALSYADLLARAEAIAARLRARGVGRECVVGLGLPKSPEYVVSLVGTWLAGAAFVPLDPDLPRERLDFLVQDSEPAIVLARHRDADVFHGVAVFDADEAVGTLASQRLPSRPPTAGASSSGRTVEEDDLAYLLYTSGTTGRPKGVAVTHRGLLNLFDAQIEAFRLDPSSRSLLYLSTNFDASISDLGTTLLAGATLVIESDAALHSVGSLLDTLRSRRISHLDLPPALLRVLEPAAMPESLRTLILGGEASPPEVVRRWARRLRVVNVYGPTEATICACLCVCDPERWDRPLLGRPLPNVSWRVEDPEGRPTPAGQSGELLLGGVCLARGYWRRPDLTAAAFVDRAGLRFYRTGDWVRRHPDGEVEFLGRIDRQVKLHGLRVEPEELEARLLGHSEVAQAVVHPRILSSNSPGAESRLVLRAYVVLRRTADAAKCGPADLRTWLAAFLPRWMLPQRIEILERLPLTATGKPDFAALAALPEDRARRPPALPPSTREEALLLEIWRGVLGRDDLSLHDDFFACGGDSLAALQVVAAAEARGLFLSPASVLAHPTIAELAAVSSAGGGPTSPRSLEGIGGEGMAADDLRRDVSQVAAELPLPRPAPDPALTGDSPRVFFLTGGTGFLGSRLLDEFLRRSEARILCLVRASTTAEGLARLRQALAAHGLPPPPELTRRVTVVPGELERERFGLAAPAWEDLARGVDAIVHCGAQVKLALPYATLRAANVGGTRETLRLQGAGAPKRLHHVSTLSVFVATDRNAGPMEEDDDLARTQTVFGGYAQTKWAAERLVRSAPAAAGAHACYRLGLVTGDSRTGYAPANQLLTLFLRGAAALGCLPEDALVRLKLDVTPVDFAAAALAHLVLRAPSGGHSPTFHLANPRSLSLGELVAALRAFGKPIEALPAPAWHARVAATLASRPAPDTAAALLALCRCLAPAVYGSYRTLDLFQATGADFRMERAAAGLHGSGLACPPPGADLLAVYLRHAFSTERAR